LFALAGLALIALALGAAVWALADLPHDLRRGTLGLCVLLALVYLAFHFGFWYPLRARRIYREYKAASLPFSAEITEHGIQVDNELGKGLLPWSHIRKWREGSSVFLLYPTDALYHILPKDVFSPESMQEFRKTLNERLGPAA
jgi:hypothetical protein